MIDAGSRPSEVSHESDVRDGSPPRVLGSYGPAEGHQLIVVTAIHGNEPAGLQAAQRVLDELRRRDLPLAGRMTALIGNREAFARGQRFLDTDLNRLWTADRIEAARDAAVHPGKGQRSEDHELLELHDTVDQLFDQGEGRPICLDLHSTSGAGVPFLIMSDTLRNRRVAFALQIPVLLGLEEQIDGTILQYFGDRCQVAFAIEGGQHEDPRTVDHLESSIWCALVAGRILDPRDFPEIEQHRFRLREARGQLPSVLEVFHRHSIARGAEFRMEPGFASFSSVRAGELLAYDASGSVICPRDAVLIMPLYQGQGSDGFFLGKPIAGFWLKLSATLRRLRLDRAMGVLPGVHHDAADPSTLLVDQRIARWYTREIFHLFGFRYCGLQEGQLVFRRRAG